MKIFLYENDDEFLDIFKKITIENSMECEIINCSSGQEVLDHLSKSSPDIIIMERNLKEREDNLRLITALKEERNFISAVIDTVGSLVIVLNPQGRIIRFNQACEQLTGYTFKEVENKCYWDIFLDQVEVNLARCFFEVLTPEDFPFEIENSWLMKDGTSRMILWSNTAVLEQDGSIKSIICTGVDITKRKQIEEDLRETNGKLYTLINASPLAVLSLDLEGRVKSWSTAAEHIFGWSELEVTGSQPPIFNKDQMAEFSSWFKRVLKGKLLTGKEVYCRRKNGQVIDISLSAAPLRNREGQVIGVMAVAADITERKQAEKALIESEQRMADIINFLPDATFAVDLQGKVIAWNRAIEELTGIKAKDILGKGDYEYSIPFYGDRRINIIDLVFKPETYLAKNYPNIQKSDDNSLYGEAFCPRVGSRGAFLWFKATPLYDTHGNIVGAIESIRDITKRKQVEEQLRYLSFHDMLTGLYNRAYFEEELKRLDTERQLPLGIIIGDFNGLKLVNDAFGHQQGDRLLMKGVEILKESCRKDDIICRWGGDEFAILLPRTDEKSAEEICLRIKNSCRKAGEEPIPVSISLGAAIKFEMVQDIKKTIKEAEDRMYRNKLLESKSVHNSVISFLQKNLAERTNETEEHTFRIQKLARQLGNELDLSINEMEELVLLSALHDIGLIAVPDSIIKKSGTLGPEEWEIMKKHCEIGYRIAQASPHLVHIAEKILAHHECWDGTGYPKGLKGKDIPLISRIVAVLDAYDKMITGRSYEKAKTKKEALQEIKRCAGSQFDPEIVEKFIKIIYLESKTKQNNNSQTK